MIKCCRLLLAVLVTVPACLTTGDNIDPGSGAEGTGTGSTGGGGGSGSGSGNGSGSGSGSAGGSGSAAGRVFLTRGSYAGALVAYVSGTTDGLAAGDAICQVRADAAGLGGTWVAWLSSSNRAAIDRVRGNGPWQLVGGGIAFQNRAQLQTEPSISLRRDETGAVAGGLFPWTGTRSGGRSALENCSDWTSIQVDGLIGDETESTPTFDWTEHGHGSCAVVRPLVCLEQS